ncbi:MAG TPA: Amuc_1100 family pilus-like protein [Chthoniobacterales bacterium]|nr:Amuc_1100 family pilus-like protein [Chthoniobacterales bacterium]
MKALTNWLRANRFLGALLILFAPGALGAAWFLFSTKSHWDAARMRFDRTSAELNRLERLTPYPSEENLRTVKADAEEYAIALAKLKEELRSRVAPATAMKPNEFQSRLRVAVSAIVQKARASKVKLPDKFYLGFEEFAAALPNEFAAPLLGQELSQIEWFLNDLIEDQIEALTAFRRTPLPEEQGSLSTIPTPSPAITTTSARPPPPPFARNVVEATFVSTPAAARRVLNQIAGAKEQFCIIRLLHVRNEKLKGPPHEPVPEATPGIISTTPPGPPAAKSSPQPGLNFIVGNERIETTAKIEIVRFVF